MNAQAPVPSANPKSGFQILLSPLVIKYTENTPTKIATNTGTHLFDAAILSSLYKIKYLANARKIAAINPPNTGEITQLAAIIPI